MKNIDTSICTEKEDYLRGKELFGYTTEWEKHLFLFFDQIIRWATYIFYTFYIFIINTKYLHNTNLTFNSIFSFTEK